MLRVACFNEGNREFHMMSLHNTSDLSPKQILYDFFQNAVTNGGLSTNHKAFARDNHYCLPIVATRIAAPIRVSRPGKHVDDYTAN